MSPTVPVLTTVLGAVLLLAGCGGSGASDGGETVVAAFYPLAFASEQVAGPGVHVVDLTRAGEEPHDLELSPRDVARIHEAKLVVYAGHGFQPAVEDAVRDRRGPSLDVLADVRLRGSGDDVDPHVWLDPLRYARRAQAVSDQRAQLLIARRHVASSGYDGNADRLAPLDGRHGDRSRIRYGRMSHERLLDLRR